MTGDANHRIADTKPREIDGFHGTSIEAADSILSNGFTISQNSYDWLGDGVYFFQDAPLRAREWALERHGNGAMTLKARIRLADCMDFLDVMWASLLSDFYDEFLGHLKLSSIPLPAQTTGAHRLDSAVINYAAGILHEKGINVRSVRAAFSEGIPAFPNSAICNLSHVQIAVRDLSVISNIRREYP